MRCILILTIAVLSALNGSFAQTSSYKDLFDLSPYERTVLIIKFYEGMHHNQGEYIGYGHHILPDENFKPNQELTTEEADILLRCDVLKLYQLFKDYGKDAWLLTALSYNIGAYALLGYPGHPKSELLKALENGQRDIHTQYITYCHYQGKPHKGLVHRRQMELALLYEK